MEKETESREYYKGLIEALIFLSSEPLKIANIAGSAGIDKAYARELADELVLDYSEKNGGIVLKEIGGGYQFTTNEIYFRVLGSIFKEKKRETLSKSTLDTLAIISYKQPITLPEIDEIRGVSSRAMVTTLIAKKLVKAVGQKEVPGRPTLYGTTNDFLIHFGLNKLSDLPTPVEVKELNLDNLDDIKLSDDDPVSISAKEKSQKKEKDSDKGEDEIGIEEELNSEEETNSNDEKNLEEEVNSEEEINTENQIIEENNIDSDNEITPEEISSDTEDELEKAGVENKVTFDVVEKNNE
ncbi:MAG: SMC-Scp complex subunit ScpB [Leptospiraceae bacterium]|nr:SMC-Scp complex subunit ScpB [Leptospiraceae bacterium]